MRKQITELAQGYNRHWSELMDEFNVAADGWDIQSKLCAAGAFVNAQLAREPKFDGKKQIEAIERFCNAVQRIHEQVLKSHPAMGEANQEKADAFDEYFTPKH